MNAIQTAPATLEVAPRNVPRSIGALIAGFVGVFVVTTLVDVVLHVTGVFPPMGAPPMSDGLFALALAYRIVFDIAGGALTARLAPRNPLGHALVLGGIGTALATVGAVVMWDAGPGWYSLANIAIAIPAPWLGARVATR